ncbi:MAG: hypothetical protein MUF87_18580 [Anaerolineae bacterium]|nr:hypothetical protein [Anaerolineae bacterium]
MMTRVKQALRYLLIGGVLASCVPIQPTLTPDPTETTHTLIENQPITHENMQIVFGNCGEHTYTNLENQTQTGFACQMSTVTDGDRVLSIESRGADRDQMRIGIKMIE